MPPTLFLRLAMLPCYLPIPAPLHLSDAQLQHWDDRLPPRWNVHPADTTADTNGLEFGRPHTDARKVRRQARDDIG